MDWFPKSKDNETQCEAKPYSFIPRPEPLRTDPNLIRTLLHTCLTPPTAPADSNDYSRDRKMATKAVCMPYDASRLGIGLSLTIVFMLLVLLKWGIRKPCGELRHRCDTALTGSLSMPDQVTYMALKLHWQLPTQVSVRTLTTYPLVYDSRMATVTAIAVNPVSAKGALTRIAFLSVCREDFRVPHPVTVSLTFVSSGRKEPNALSLSVVRLRQSSQLPCKCVLTSFIFIAGGGTESIT
jgi:hypothetical protein